MKKHTAFVSALIVGFLALSTLNGLAVGGAGSADALPAVVVPQEEAAKKYPPPQGKKTYPDGVATASGPKAQGFIQSPYSTRVYDCRKVARGALVLDEPLKKVFVRP